MKSDVQLGSLRVVSFPNPRVLPAHSPVVAFCTLRIESTEAAFRGGARSDRIATAVAIGVCG
jgi:hypothetical protein